VTDTFDALSDAWQQALPAVLRLLGAHPRDLYRHELQRFLATSRFQPDAAEQTAPQLHEMLLTSLRASRQPAALSLTREWPTDAASMVRLAEKLLSFWSDALEASKGEAPACDPSGMGGEVFFGPRLGGPGRPGSVTSDPSPKD
jgi:hypothetical protein